MITSTATRPMCDFCGAAGAADLTWFPARSFRRLTIARPGAVIVVPCVCHCDLPPITPDDEVTEYVSLSAWVGCAGCRAYIDAGDAGGLVERVTAILAAQAPGETPERLLLAVRASHAGYWLHQTPAN